MKRIHTIRIAADDEEILRCWEVLFELRPHLKKKHFVRRIRGMIFEGYRLAYIEEQSKVVSIIGFRYLNLLYSGKHYYIDDLSTLSDYRNNGYGSALLDFVIQLARDAKYDCVMLDSGHARHTAHRLYLNKGFEICSHHFCKSI